MSEPERIVGLLASPVARYVGRPRDGAPDVVAADRVEQITVRAGLGVVGDRYFGRPAHRRASITLLAVEQLDRVAADLGVVPFDPWLTRRTVLLRGVPVDDLVARTVELDSGDGPVRLQVNRPANPCAWMDTVLAPGAFRALRGRGGVRCEPLTDGRLRVGPVTVRVL